MRDILEENGIPCYMVDKYAFFRRQEVKDAVAALNIITNPYDARSMCRIIGRVKNSIGTETLGRIFESGPKCGLRLKDFVYEARHKEKEPFEKLLCALETENLVLFDLETTGLDTNTDEIIEIAAARCGKDGIVEEFRAFIKNKKPVGRSEDIHGFSDAFLQKNGKTSKTC